MNLDDNEIEKEILLNFYKEHSNWSRHQESQRAIVSNLLLSISIVLIGLITFDKKIGMGDLPLTLFLVVVGVFGAVFTYKYYVQFKFHDSRVDLYKQHLNLLLKDIDVYSEEVSSDDKLSSKYLFFARFRLYKLWIYLNGIIVASGAFLSIIAIR